MTSRNQLLTAAGAVAFALFLSGLVEAHGGPHQVGAHLGLKARGLIVQTALWGTAGP